MNRAAWRIVLSLVVAAAPALATSNGEPIRRTGAAIDGGLNCTQCHNQFAPPVNQGNGRIQVNAEAYTPGVRQGITIQITDNAALVWGFQITARLASDETRQAGSFTATDLIRVQCDGREGPCGGAVEFASHRPTSTGGGVRNQRTYTLEWTPPGRDAGQVIFYAAGLAADGHGLESGSRTYTTSFRIGSLGCHFDGKPAILPNGVTTGATLQPVISAGSLISIFGVGFANAGNKYSLLKSDLVDGRVPPDLACVALEIGGQRASVLQVESSLIKALAPNLNPGSTIATVIVNPGGPNELRSDPAPVEVQPFSPGFFTAAGTTTISGRNASDGNNPLSDQPGVGVFARPGDIVTLYGTGFGPTNPLYQPGEFPAGPAGLLEPITVTVGETTLANEDILYAGLSLDTPGYYQFDLRVPADTPDGNVPVVIGIAGQQTQDGVTIPVKR